MENCSYIKIIMLEIIIVTFDLQLQRTCMHLLGMLSFFSLYLYTERDHIW